METILAHCQALFSQNGSMFAVFFLGGLMGSLTHCLVMCGPLVACQSACGRACGKVSQTMQLPYHLGRLLTYSALGFLAALLGRQLTALPYWETISSLMLAVAGVVFILSSLPAAQHHRLLMASNNRFIRGALMGFMPCGLLYAALMMAATLSNPLAGMVAMALFVLGTMPALLLASAGATLLSQKWQGKMHQLGRAGIACNGLALLVIAAKLVR